MTRKGNIWISAALYFGLGMVVLSIILAAGMPVINKLQDKNIILQTKDVFFTLDNHVREVARGGPGTQRLLRVQMKRGSMEIDSDADTVSWSYQTKALLSEPGVPITEGNLQILTEPGNVVGEWETTLFLDYDGVVDLDYTTGGVYALQGGTDLVIQHASTTGDVVNVVISENL